ncbi:hypothetical protein, partial [Clostridium perfringens]
MFSIRSKNFLPLLVDSVTIATDKLVINAQRQIIKSMMVMSVLLACPPSLMVLDISMSPMESKIRLV